MSRTFVFGMKPRAEFGEILRPTPAGEKCLMCSEEIAPGDMGEWVLHVRPDGSSQHPAHWECCLRNVIGGLNHLMGTCRCCGGSQPPDPEGMTPRQAAVAAAQFYYATSAPEKKSLTN